MTIISAPLKPLALAIQRRSGCSTMEARDVAKFYLTEGRAKIDPEHGIAKVSFPSDLGCRTVANSIAAIRAGF